jgi:N-acetylglutamate synthase-like GNAT family acetyltransferase
MRRQDENLEGRPHKLVICVKIANSTELLLIQCLLIIEEKQNTTLSEKFLKNICNLGHGKGAPI